MKILTFLHSFEPGGVERVALRLTAYWQKENHDAPVFMGRPEGAGRISEANQLRLIYPAKPPVSPALLETLWMIATLPSVIRREKPDVLFCAGNSYSVVAVAMKLLLGSDCPPIVAKISNDLGRRDLLLPARWLYHSWLRIQAPFLDEVVAMEASMQPEIANCMGMPGERISVIPDPAISDSYINRLSLHRDNRAKPAHGRHFVAIGRLTRQKNLPMMLRAFAKGSGGDDKLTIVGNGPLRKSLETQAVSLGLGNRVHFTGHVSNIGPFLAQADFYLMSSHYEGVPAVLIEALAACLPIITTDCSNAISAMLGADRIKMARQFTIENSAHRYTALFARLANQTFREQQSHKIRNVNP